MSILRKDQTSEKALNPAISSQFDRALRFQNITNWAESKFKVAKSELMELVEKDDTLELVVGEGYRLPQGMIIVQERSNYSFDTQAMIKKLKKKEVSVDDLISCISTWKTEDVERVFGSGVIIKKEPTTYATLRASSETKDDFKGMQQSVEKAMNVTYIKAVDGRLKRSA